MFSLKSIVFLASLVLSFFSPFAFAYADELSTSAEDLGGSLSISIEDTTDSTFKTGSSRGFDSLDHKTDIQITADLSKSVRAVLTLELEQQLQRDGIHLASNFDIGSFINEAYIEIKNVNGKPIAFIVGKQQVAFGQDASAMPNPDASPLHDISVVDQVFGFTVSLENIGFFDLVEASVFETGSGDLKIGDVDGASFRLTKNVTDKIAAEVSYLHAGKGPDDDENRVSVGFIYENGDWNAWIEGVYFQGYEDYPNSDYGITTGASKKLGPGTVVIEASYIHNAFTQIGIGYRFEISKNLEVGPELRYVVYDDGRQSDTQLTVRVLLKFEK